ncbi:MAG: hypothetical protein ACWGQW_05620 [bacterium]
MSRPKVSNLTVPLTCRITPKAKARLKRLARVHERPQARVINDLIMGQVLHLD